MQDGFIKLYDSDNPDALLLEITQNLGDTLTRKDGQMLIHIQGVSINSKPRADGRYQGYINCGTSKRYFYGYSREEVAYKISDFLKKGGMAQKNEPKHADTFAEYTEKWLTLYKIPNLKISTITNIRNTLKPALEHFGKRPMRSIKADELQEFLLGMQAERMRDLCKTYLSQIFKKALAQDVIRKNPFDTIEIKAHKQKRKPALTQSEQRQFLQHIQGSKYELLFRVLLHTGLRIGEALALEKSDIQNGCISVSKNVVFVDGKRIVQDSPKTVAGRRTIPIPSSIEKELKQTSDTTLFPYTYNAIHIALSKISDALGFNVTAHTLRHTFATRLEEQNIPPKIRQYLLGHASIKMTLDTYTDTQQEYVERFNSQLRALYSDI